MKNLFALFLINLPFLISAQVSEFIHVDQFGYLSQKSKFAVISNPQEGFNGTKTFTPSSTLALVDASTNESVFEAEVILWNNGLTHPQSGDQGWWFDFSTYTQAGSYYVFDDLNDERSAVFKINNNPYEELLKVASKMFYYNRCNAEKKEPYADPKWTDGMNFDKPLQDENCRSIFNPNDASLEKDLSGGWFDAGDNNKYVTFAESAVHNLLGAYQENPNIFGDDWNLPESGNSIPDIIDELLWELNWVCKMVNEDGSTIIKMGNQNHSENTDIPPSANQDQRFYGNRCSSASASAASMLAHASKVLQTIEGTESDALFMLEKAKIAWDFFKEAKDNNALETDCDNGEIVAGDADRNEEEQIESALIAAIYLYELTNEEKYHNFIKSEYNKVEPISNDFWGPYKISIQEALLNYSNFPNADDNIVSVVLNSAQNNLNDDFNGFYKFSENDLFRAQSPDWIYHWGSNMPKANIGNLCMLFNKFDVNSELNENLMNKAYEHLHYFHGVNPLGLVQLSNMYEYGGDHCVNEIYHTWFYDGSIYDHALNSSNGPAPGFVTGGVNQYYSIEEFSPPFGQPLLKSYLDFNDGYPINSWEISEPAIYYQAAYIRLLAHFVNNEILNNQNAVDSKEKIIAVFPNPSKDFLNLRGLEGEVKVSIYNGSGKIVKTWENISQASQLDIKSLTPGSYVVKVSREDDQFFFSDALIKF